MKWRMRGVRSACAAGVAVLLCAALAIPPAHAVDDPVPYVDRIGCGTGDTRLTPVLGWSGRGEAVASDYAPTTLASGYPDIAASFRDVSGSPAYDASAPTGYGEAGPYRDVLALVARRIREGDGFTLELTLPHAQRIQLTVGGLQAPGRVRISASGPSGAAPAQGAARSTSGATVVVQGAAVDIIGADLPPRSDDNPASAADVWFDTPVDRLVVTVSAEGRGVEPGFFITPPIGCQTGSARTAVTVGAPRDAGRPERMTHALEVVTTVRNTADAGDMALYPDVSVALPEALAAEGLTLDRIVSLGASDPACAAPGADGGALRISGHDAALSPGESCTHTWRVVVSGPADGRTRETAFRSTLRSSPHAAGREKSALPTTLSFPASPPATSPSPTPSREPTPAPTPSRAPAPEPTALPDPSDIVTPSSPPRATPPARVPAPLPLDPIAPPPSAGPLGPAPAPETSPTPSSSPSPSARPSSVPSPGPPADPPSSRGSFVPITLSSPHGGLRRGTASTLRGTIGPHRSTEPADVALVAQLDQGFAYRSVRVRVGDVDLEACTVESRSFSCAFPLAAGEAAELEVRLFAEPSAVAALAGQRITLTEGGTSRDLRFTTDVASDDAALRMGSSPGALLPLLVLLLFALAARVAHRRHD